MRVLEKRGEKKAPMVGFYHPTTGVFYQLPNDPQILQGVQNKEHRELLQKMLSFMERREMHGDQIFFTDQNLNAEQPISVEGTNSHFQHRFKLFISDFNRENVRVYHKQITAMLQQNKYCFLLYLSDLKLAEEKLYDRLIASPLEMISVLEEAVRSYVLEKSQEFSNYDQRIPWQVCIKSDENPKPLRDIQSSSVARMFVVSGIIISCTKPYIKASELKVKCKNCQLVKTIKLAPGQMPYVPPQCPGQGGASQKCPLDPFVALPESTVIDTQNLKIQENPEEIPTGEIARTMGLIADRYNVNRCVPGDRVRITVISTVIDVKTDNLFKQLLYVTGVEKMKERSNIQYTTQEQEIFKKMSRDPNLYKKIYSSIAPGIFGNEEIKKVIGCMLFGGSRKHLPDRTVLRGDINVLLLGDPSTAKSQFLKFVEQTASIAVYTSGKGSSAAGLTASINKDMMTGEFQIEGGALVLADGGIVCIDEFDKMRPADRVAIHEAMEQQTISVAKAGITTRLNSRASVLAAANPIFGKVDDTKQISEQIELQTTILSRFDSIFLVKDDNQQDTNLRIAKHILDLHQGRIQKEIDSDIPFDVLKKYINYARNRIMPRLSPSACDKLQNIYIADRQKAKEQKKHSKNTIPITVRQLEAVIRLSEALAKMSLRTEVTTEDVAEAHYLFEISTMKTIEGNNSGIEVVENQLGEIQKIKEAIRKRVAIGNSASISHLADSLDKYPKDLIKYAIHDIVRNGEFKEIKGGKSIIRQA